MTGCAEFQPLVSTYADGGLDPAASRRLEGHLASCERCRTDLADTRFAFELARLPPISDAERRALVTLPAGALTELRRDRVGTPIWRAFAAGFAAAAAIAVYLAAPTQLPPRFTPPGAAVAERWQVPDPDELLQAVGADEEVVEAGELARAEQLADAAYADATAEQ